MKNKILVLFLALIVVGSISIYAKYAGAEEQLVKMKDYVASALDTRADVVSTGLNDEEASVMGFPSDFGFPGPEMTVSCFNCTGEGCGNHCYCSYENYVVNGTAYDFGTVGTTAANGSCVGQVMNTNFFLHNPI